MLQTVLARLNTHRSRIRLNGEDDLASSEALLNSKSELVEIKSNLIHDGTQIQVNEKDDTSATENVSGPPIIMMGSMDQKDAIIVSSDKKEFRVHAYKLADCRTSNTLEPIPIFTIGIELNDYRLCASAISESKKFVYNANEKSKEDIAYRISLPGCGVTDLGAMDYDLFKTIPDSIKFALHRAQHQVTKIDYSADWIKVARDFAIISAKIAQYEKERSKAAKSG
ncbi:uncharacterized protein L201_007270 [Kwoniella dendrophila CBS 6074]|uniref:Uncharacterized protein n=1 Tax=Kwoniella dendrophila CBS 6074 TaxID=1295534 RepID=A0AAX4K3Y9_9TREE